MTRAGPAGASSGLGRHGVGEFAQHTAAFDGTADIALGNAVEAGALVFFYLKDTAAGYCIGLVLVTALGAELALAIGLAGGSGFALAGAAGAYIARASVTGAAITVLFMRSLLKPLWPLKPRLAFLPTLSSKKTAMNWT